MRRRDFVVLGGAAAATLLVQGPALAQTGRKRLGFVITTTPGDPSYMNILARVRQSLAGYGWSEPATLTMDVRYAEGDAAQIPVISAGIVADRPDVILTGNTPTTMIMRNLTGTIPIVFAGLSDPVGTGLVESLRRPGGNVTGFASFEFVMVSKWMELLKQFAPDTTSVGILYNPRTAPFIIPYLGEAAAVAEPLGMTVVDCPVTSLEEIEATYARVGALQPAAMVVIPDTYNYSQPQRGQIIALAEQHRIAAIYAFSVHAIDGGLLSYGPNQVDQFVRATNYIDRIFRGADPAELPVQGPLTFDLIINLKTAGALGLTFPVDLIAQATQIIE